MSETHTEKLFEAEANLRQAALNYATTRHDVASRKALRAAAIAYAEQSQDIDTAMDAWIAAEPTTELAP